MICRLPLRVFHLLWEMGGYKQFEKKPFPTFVLIFVFAIMPFHDKHVFFCSRFLPQCLLVAGFGGCFQVISQFFGRIFPPVNDHVVGFENRRFFFNRRYTPQKGDSELGNPSSSGFILVSFWGTP